MEETQIIYKKIYDPVHGFIRFSSLEKDLIDSYAFQRLHYIHQLGVAYLVYPGASHTRFEHSLGVMEVATQIFDKILENFLFRQDAKSIAYWRQVVRFAALCHDLGHLPFSHLAEKRLLGEGGHEKWTVALIESSFLSPVWNHFQLDFPKENVLEDVIKIAIGEKKLKTLNSKWDEVVFSPWDKVMGQVIAGDFFGADRIDYLLRDARCTGVSYGLFDYHQLIEMLRILPCEEDGKQSLTLGIEENGIESCEALLLARHFMHKRVYQHPSVQAYSFHMARFMEKIYAKEDPLSSLGKYLSFTDNEVLRELRLAFLDPAHESHEDALSIFVRENRYLAVELPTHLQKEDVQDWKGRFHMSETSVESFFVDLKKGESLFSFPVVRGEKTVDASSCSAISIPSVNSNWLYVSPKYSDSISQLLERL